MTEQINYISGNLSNKDVKDTNLYIVSTNTGFKTYYKDNFVPVRIKLVEGGIKFAHILETTNLYVYVSDNAPTSLIIWDDVGKSIIRNINFNEPIMNVKITRHYIAVILKNKVLLHDLKEFKKIKEYNTADNENGLCLLTDKYLICLGDTDGNVNIVDLSNFESKNIQAHKSPITVCNMSYDDKYLVTASVKGTIIRLINIMDNVIVREFRRGLTQGNIHNCVFNYSDNITSLLCVTSNTGTIHLYNLLDDDQNYKSYLKPFKPLLPEYFDSTWSSISLNDNNTVSNKHICIFDNSGMNKLYIVSYDGTHSTYKYDILNKTLIKEKTHKLILDTTDSSVSE